MGSGYLVAGLTERKPPSPSRHGTHDVVHREPELGERAQAGGVTEGEDPAV